MPRHGSQEELLRQLRWFLSYRRKKIAIKKKQIDQKVMFSLIAGLTIFIEDELGKKLNVRDKKGVFRRRVQKNVALVPRRFIFAPVLRDALNQYFHSIGARAIVGDEGSVVKSKNSVYAVKASHFFHLLQPTYTTDCVWNDERKLAELVGDKNNQDSEELAEAFHAFSKDELKRELKTGIYEAWLSDKHALLEKIGLLEFTCLQGEILFELKDDLRVRKYYLSIVGRTPAGIYVSMN